MGVDFFKSRTEYTEEGGREGGVEGGEIPMDRFGESDSHVHYGLPARRDRFDGEPKILAKLMDRTDE